MNIYVKEIRPALANPGVDRLFIKEDGDGFPEGTIGSSVVASSMISEHHHSGN